MGYVYKGTKYGTGGRRTYDHPTQKAGQKAGGLQPCGTYAAYRRHNKKGEDACDPCLAANRAEGEARRRRRGVPVRGPRGKTKKTNSQDSQGVTS